LAARLVICGAISEGTQLTSLLRWLTLLSLSVAACSLDVSRKNHCVTARHCRPGHSCVNEVCVADRAVGTCTDSAVATCDTSGAVSSCEERFCGGRLWRDGPRSPATNIQYRIHDPTGEFSAGYRDAIRAGAAAWARATGYLLVFKECSTCASGVVDSVA
jgi:hypothetical protein